MKRKTLFFIVSTVILLTTFSCEKSEVLTPENYVNCSFFVRNKKADLYTTARGNKLTNAIIINIHGGPAQGAQLIAQTRPAAYEELEKLGIVVYYDQRGIGLSTGNFPETTITLAQFTDDLNSLVEVCKNKFGANKKVFFLSRSWGGLLAANYLMEEERQDKISGWINIAGAFDLPKIVAGGKSNLIKIADEQIALNQSADHWKEIKSFATAFDTTDYSWNNLNQLWDVGVEGMELLYANGAIVEEWNTTGLSNEELAGSTAYSSFEVTQNDWQGIPQTIMTPLLTTTPEMGKITIPSFFIYGYYDLIVPSDLAIIGLENISTPSSDKYLQIYSNQGHLPMGNLEQFTLNTQNFIQKYD